MQAHPAYPRYSRALNGAAESLPRFRGAAPAIRGAAPAIRGGAFVLLAALALLAGLAATSPPALADMGDFTWGAIESIDTGTIAVSSPAGRSVAGLDDGAGQTWHVVFLKDNRVYHVARTQAGWGAPEPISPVGIQAGNPQIARTGATFHIVWQDSRLGHPEIWTRRSSAGGGWTAEECLTSDAIGSSAPSLDGESAGVLVWAEAVSTPASIKASFWENGSWSAPVPVSASGSLATEPSASISNSYAGSPFNATVAWSDFRHGSPEIYARRRVNGLWQAEQRLTNFAGPCFSPSVHTEECCGDEVSGDDQITFVTHTGGIDEVWCVLSRDPGNALKISANGVTAPQAGIAGFSFNQVPLVPFGGPYPVDLAAWKEGTAIAPGRLLVQNVAAGSASQSFTEAIIGGPVIGAAEGDPLGGILVVWTEQQGPAQVLKARLGTALSCTRDEIVAPASFLIGPEGIPGNIMRIRDQCSNEFVFRPYSASLHFDPALNAALTWDQDQPHPNTPEFYPNPSGAWTFSVQGGGCSSAGNVEVIMSALVVWGWAGVRSPDVDGDCVVRVNDLAYVQLHLGSADFCADLDGSGLVDQSDVAIVQATMGDMCTSLTAVEDGPANPDDGSNTDPNPAPHNGSNAGAAGARLLGVQVIPNPAREAVAFRLTLQTPANVALVVLDAGGRCVRNLGTRTFPEGGSAVLWDAKDDGGRNVAAGVYFVCARAGAEETRRSVILLPR